jgi:hypothetical protein
MDKSIPQVEYGQDIQEMARSADGPFSTRVPNSSDTALLYAQVPDPSKPIEFKTSLEPASLAQAYELAHEPAKVEARQAVEMSPASGTNSAVSWQLPGSFQAAPIASAPTKEVERSQKNEYDMGMGM